MEFVILFPCCRFFDGIRSLGLLSAVQQYPGLFKQFFLRSNQPLTSEIIKNLFPYELSPEGSNRRRAETDVVTYWCDFLLDIEGTLTDYWNGLSLSMTTRFLCEHNCEEIEPIMISITLSWRDNRWHKNYMCRNRQLEEINQNKAWVKSYLVCGCLMVKKKKPVFDRGNNS